MIEIPYKEEYTLYEGGNAKKWVYWVFFGILAFIAIYFPFFGSNLRYKTGTFFSAVLNGIGAMCLIFGGLILVWGILSIFCGRTMGGIKTALLGFLILVIGFYCLNPGYFGIITSGKDVPKGYH